MATASLQTGRFKYNDGGGYVGQVRTPMSVQTGRQAIALAFQRHRWWLHPWWQHCRPLPCSKFARRAAVPFRCPRALAVIFCALMPLPMRASSCRRTSPCPFLLMLVCRVCSIVATGSGTGRAFTPTRMVKSAAVPRQCLASVPAILLGASTDMHVSAQATSLMAAS